MKSVYDRKEWILGGYVLHPLLILGLIEHKGLEGDSYITEKDSIRVSPLWLKFIHFGPSKEHTQAIWN